MGMFDWYKPNPTIYCPVCQMLLDEWQSKDVSCALLVWEQGHISPVDQLAGDASVDLEERLAIRLPEQFSLYSYSCKCEPRVDAYGYCVNEVWTRTELFTADNIKPGFDESMREFRLRQKKLREWWALAK